MNDRSGQQRPRRGRTKDAELVHRLGPEALGQLVAQRHHGRCADIEEVPAHAEQDERIPVVHVGLTVEADQAGADETKGADRHHTDDPETLDQVAGKQRRHIHAEHVTSNDLRHFLERESVMHVHAERGRGHDECHDAVSGRAAEDGHDEHRLAHDLPERPATVRCRVGAFAAQRAQCPEQHGLDDVEDSKDNQRAEVLHRRYGELAVLDELRPDQGPADCTQQYVGNCARRMLCRYALRSGVAILLRERHVDAEHGARQHEQPEALDREGATGYPDAERSAQRGQRESLAATDTTHQHRRGHSRRRHAQHHDGHRQGRQGRVFCQLRADDSAEGHHDDGAGGGDQLATDQDDDVA